MAASIANQGDIPSEFNVTINKILGKITAPEPSKEHPVNDLIEIVDIFTFYGYEYSNPCDICGEPCDYRVMMYSRRYDNYGYRCHRCLF